MRDSVKALKELIGETIDGEECDEVDVEEFVQLLSQEFVKLTEQSNDPHERAKQRMDDAAKRGGIEKMIRDTLTRIQRTSEPEKLDGIVSFADWLIGELEKIKKEASKKNKGY
jgi:hypothetical protein